MGININKRFNEVFGLEDGVEEEKKRFVERVNQLIFHYVDTEGFDDFGYPKLFESLCFELGVNVHDFRERNVESGMRYGRDFVPATIRTVTKDNFEKTLRVLCILYKYIQLESDNKSAREWLSKQIKIVLSRCTRDIGVRWKEEFFYPSGAKEMDKPLIEETLTWLSDYKDERKDYRTALQYYSEGNSLGDVIQKCYLAIEGVARRVLGNKKGLDNNKDELLAKMNLSDGWKPILATYIIYAHDYRHASAKRHEITKQEAEAYLYMTGLIIRLTIESK
ncbi:MAG: hypothetical protein ACYSWW_04415 [Planctomycetota bacterium]